MNNNIRKTLVAAFIILPFFAHAQTFQFQVWDTVGTDNFIWPSGITSVEAEVCGSGAGGAGSIFQQLGGGGGSGARVIRIVPRPSNSITPVKVSAGGAGLPANTDRNVFGQPLGNPGGTDAVVNPSTGERDSTYFGFDTRCWGATGGQSPSSNGPGGDGGTPGICSAPAPYIYTQGGQGGASAPIVFSDGLNHAMVWGANSPCGGIGGNNQQDGASPGGGGSPGNVSLPSGGGGHGRVIVRWISLAK